ncbi:hypothetical protein ACIRYZ_46130 [Kitasatospora sp. NPDC101155]|uniref:hypothetical protein n=1 Tax=Kitasatospora sp. NPDC101155 TaxID=3364097 RepID=UPI003803421B
MAHYLPRTARPTGQGEQAGRAATAWDPVLDELRNRPDSRSSANLATVLSTPLMVLLARTLYSDSPGQDPAELLDTVRFPTPEAIEEHLLAGFVPTVYHQRPPTRTGAAISHLHPHRGWDPQHARHYLGQLAGHLERPKQRNRQDLAWWQLSSVLSLPARILAIVLACTVVTTVSDLIVNAAMRATGYPRAYSLELTIGLVAGLAVGLAFGLAYGIAVVLGKETFDPSRVRLQLPGHGRCKAGAPARRLSSAFGAGLLIGLAVGLAYGPTTTLLAPETIPRSLSGRPPVEVMLIRSFLGSVLYGTAGCLALGLMAALETPLDLKSAATPKRLLAINRGTVIRQALFVAPVITIAVTSACRVLENLSTMDWFGWLATGTQCGLIGTVSYVLAFTAWGQWVLFTRIALPLTGRLPWAVMAFLDDAYHRGVLRQVGAAYQFRHARLQSHLSSAANASEHG